MMSKSSNKTDQFLAAMRQSEVPEPPEDTSHAAAPAAEPEPAAAVVRELPRPRAVKPKTPPRAGLKHFGGYLDDDTLEKIALLRVRLKKDNSELIKQAIDELYRKHNAKRAFGDA
jgi:Ribbon-helix-helix protein, copG family